MCCLEGSWGSKVFWKERPLFRMSFNIFARNMFTFVNGIVVNDESWIFMNLWLVVVHIWYFEPLKDGWHPLGRVFYIEGISPRAAICEGPLLCVSYKGWQLKQHMKLYLQGKLWHILCGWQSIHQRYCWSVGFRYHPSTENMYTASVWAVAISWGSLKATCWSGLMKQLTWSCHSFSKSTSIFNQ